MKLLQMESANQFANLISTVLPTDPVSTVLQTVISALHLVARFVQRDMNFYLTEPVLFHARQNNTALKTKPV